MNLKDTGEHCAKLQSAHANSLKNMEESKQQSKLEEKVLPTEALEVLVRIGNNRKEKESFLVHIYESTPIFEILKYLEREGYIKKINMISTGDYDRYDAPFTQKGREIYERIKQDALNIFKGEPFFIVNPPKYTYSELFDHKYELAPEDEEDEELEERHDIYFGNTKEEQEEIQVWLDRRTKIDNALHNMIERAYILFHEHPELDPKSVLEKYRADFESIEKKILGEKFENGR